MPIIKKKKPEQSIKIDPGLLPIDSLAELGQEGVSLGDNNYKVEFLLSICLGAVVY